MIATVMQMMIVGAIAVGTLFLVMWVIHLVLKNAAVVDVGWGLGFILLALIYIIMGQGFNLRNTIYFVMIFLWGTRIVLYLLKRISAEKDEDKRYKKSARGLGRWRGLSFWLFLSFKPRWK